MNADTWDELLKWVVPQMQAHAGTEDITIVFDAAPQHGAEATSLSATESVKFGAKLVCIPPNSTHVLQPCDQYVIANLKQAWRTSQQEGIEELAMNLDISDQTQSDNARSIPVMRGRAYAYLLAAFRELSPQAIRLSWYLTWIATFLWGEHREDAVTHLESCLEDVATTVTLPQKVPAKNL